MKRLIANFLLSFVLISVGFAVGKEMALRSIGATPAEPAPVEQAVGDKVLVYYMHQTFRCVTCNQIEAMAAEVVKTEFAKEVADGRVEWRLENFQRSEELAKRYNVASSCVVVVQLRDGEEAAHETLDGVWTLVDKPEEFRQYVASAIRGHLGEARAQ